MDEGYHSRYLAYITLGVIVAAIAFASWHFQLFGGAGSRMARETTGDLLRRNNPDFVQAQAFASQKDYQSALASFRKAFSRASGDAERGVIAFDIALTQQHLGDYVQAIQSYKAVAAETAYPPVVRAYAVQEIGIMAQAYYDALPAIRAETFKGDPYASFLANGDYATSYRKLFEYAASIYPLTLSEDAVAQAYMRDLMALKGATTTAQGAADVQNIVTALKAGQGDLPRLLSNQDELVYATDIFDRQAEVEKMLAQYGVPGYTYDRVEMDFVRALSYSTSLGQLAGSWPAWHYASFLADTYGASRSADIHKVLAPFSAKTPHAIDPLVATFLKQIKTDPTQVSNKTRTATIAKYDTDFKAYLVSLGWHDSDFAP